jgi:hypothetical protein
MSMNVRLLGVDALERRAAQWPQEIASAVSDEITAEVTPLMNHMRDHAMAIGGAARVSARTLRIQSTQAGMSVVAGGSGGLGAILLAGAEYGGRKRPKRAYVTRSRSGRGYVVRRRTTQQFKPHLGSRGYWFWPTARTDLRGINERVGAIVTRVVNE